MLSDSPIRVVYDCDGITRVWGFPVGRIDEEEHVRVTVTDPFGLKTDLQSGYIVDLSACTVTYPSEGAPLPPGWHLTLSRRIPFSQDVDGTQRLTSLSTLTLQLDRIVMQTQQLADMIQQVIDSTQEAQNPSYIDQIIRDIIFLEPILLPSATNALVLSMTEAARRIIFTCPDPCVVHLPPRGLVSGFHCLVRNSGGGSLSVATQGEAILENTITSWSDPTKYGSILLESVDPVYSYFVMGGLEE